ncbi:hypothetical protein [Nitratifractor sp.]
MIALYASMPPVSEEGTYDLLLTPGLYIMRKEPLGVRFVRQAKKLAPSVLDDRGIGEGWRTEVFREGGAWVFVAYDPRRIVQLLQEKGLDPRKVRKLFFAQQIPEAFEKPVRLGDGSALKTVDGTVTILPPALAGEEGEPFARIRSALSVKLPTKGFSFAAGGSTIRIDPKVLLLLSIAGGIFALSWIAEGVSDWKRAGAIEAQFMRATGGDPVLSGSLTRNNLLEKYRSIDRRQRSIRELLKGLSRLSGKDSKLQTLHVDEKGYTVQMEISPSKRSKVQNLAKDLGYAPQVSGNRFEMKGEWK